MKNTQKDRYYIKLMRFLKELNARNPLRIDVYENRRTELMKKYGFTDEDWHKAIKLVESKQYSRHFWKHTNCKNDKTPKEWKYDDHCKFEETDDEGINNERT